MTDRTPRRTETDSTDETGGEAGPRSGPADRDEVGGTDLYEVDDGVVLYDLDNPLAWIESDEAVTVARMA